MSRETAKYLAYSPIGKEHGEKISSIEGRKRTLHSGHCTQNLFAD
jgi:hypothetical protein